MKRNDIFPSKYLKAADIGEREVTLTVSHVAMEEIGMEREPKAIVYFQGTPKALVLNSTNYNTLAAVLRSDETNDWVGQCVTLRTELVAFRGAVNPAIRVKPVAATARKVQAATAAGDVGDDSIEF